MKESSLLIEFEVIDLNASYEIYGTSSNYSFKENIGKGSDLVFNSGETCSHVVSLKGNYGEFEVRVFCRSDIGVKSESLVGNISVVPPDFNGTFTINNLKIDSIEARVNQSLSIITAAENFGDNIVVEQKFGKKDLNITWELLPPGGHPKEGKSLNYDLLSDPFFSHFEIEVFSDGVLIDFSNSVSMASSLNSTNVNAILQNYREFNLNLTTEVFNELNIGREIEVKIKCIDARGGQSEALLILKNPQSDIANLIYELNGNTVQFSWRELDFDSTGARYRFIAIPDKYDIYDPSSFDISLSFYKDINSALNWEENQEYSVDEKVLYLDKVYKCVAGHTSSQTSSPVNNEVIWEKISEEVIPYKYETRDISFNSFINEQLWGYNYYYAITPKDYFGLSSEKYVAENGNFGSELFPYACKVKINNFRYTEQGDSFLFKWDFVDAYDNVIDLNQYRFTFNNIDVPSILGVNGYLYDKDSGQKLLSISDEVSSKTLDIDENGDLEIQYKNSSASIFNQYEYTREINNSLYGTQYRADGGKRSIGLQISLIGNDLNIINDPLTLIADNPAPSILSAGFREKVDSVSEVRKVKFNFNYALGFQEKTTQVYLYRIPDNQVETLDEQGNVIARDFSGFTYLDENGLPDTRTPDEGGSFVKKIIGPGDATYGDNITQIVDIHPDADDLGNEIKNIEGYYYRILPFDDFGTGVLYNVPYGGGENGLEKVIVYPRNLSSTDPKAAPGKVMRSDPTFAAGAVPGAPVGFNGTTAFENYFFSWKAPTADYDPSNPEKLLTWSENDIDHYELWISDDTYLEKNNSVWLAAENTGYRRVDGVAYSVGETPREILDPALEITNAVNLFDVPANSPSIEASYFGKTRDTKSFWVRAVDFAGNKSPFTDFNSNDNIDGLTLTLGVATATDIDDFEISMTSGFADSIALVPNNPFQDDVANGKITWDQHVLYNDGTGYIVEAGETTDGYVWWDRNNASNDLNLTNYKINHKNLGEKNYAGESVSLWTEFDYDNDPFNGVKNVYFKGLQYKTSNIHPSNNPIQNNEHIADSQDTSAPENSISLTVTDFHDGDFVVARNTNGVATPVHQAFANALIGTANIAEAAIKTAHINDLSADKITAGQIKGHRIEVFNQGDGIKTETDKAGSIGSTNFYGLEFQEGKDLLEPSVEGFVLSGDGSFAFQQGLNSLSFEEGELMLRGRMKQKNNKDYDFVEINPSPRYFSYIENDEGFQPADGFDAVDNNNISDEVAKLTITFRNSSIKGAEDIQVRAVRLFHDGSEENIFQHVNSSGGWLSVTELSAYQNNYGFRWSNDYTAAFDNGPGVFSTSVKLPVYIENGAILPGQAGFRESYHSLVEEKDVDGSSKYQDTILLYARSVHSDIQRESVITRLVDGKGTESIRVSSTSQYFKIKKDFSSDLSEITINVDTQGNNQRLKWESTKVPLYNAVDGSLITTGSSSTGYQSAYSSLSSVKVKYSDFVNEGLTPKQVIHGLSTIKVSSEQAQDIYGNPTSPSISDEISIYVLEEGSDSITTILTNENHNFHFKERYEYEKNGQPETPSTGDEYLHSGTDIQVWEGTNPLQFSTSPALSAGKFTIATVNVSTLGTATEISAGSISAVSGQSGVARVADHSNLNDSSTSVYIDYVISGRTFSDKPFAIIKRQTFSVSRDGDTSKALNIFAESYTFTEDKYTKGYSALNPQIIKINAEKKNINEVINWSSDAGLAIFRTSIVDTSASATATGEEVYIAAEDFNLIESGAVIVTASCTSNNSESFTVQDSLTISRIKDGSNVVTVKLLNENHNLPEVDEDGTFDYGGSGTDIIVFDGALRLKPVASSATLSAGQCKVSSRDKTGLSYIGSQKTTTGTNHTNWQFGFTDLPNNSMSASTFSGSITYNISFEKYNGETGSISATQTISKSIAGTSIDFVFKRNGTNPGAPTSNGSNTPTGWYTDANDINLTADNLGFLWVSRGEKRAGQTSYTWQTPSRVETEAIAEVVLYNTSGTAAPTTTFNFKENKLNALSGGWTSSVPSINSDNGKIYVSRALFLGSKNQTGVSAQGGWSSPSVYAHRLDGVAANFWFQKSVGQPTYSTTSTGITNPGSSWSDTIGGASGTGYLWSIKGSSVSGSGGTLFTFGAPEKIDGDVAAEIVLYTKSAGSVSPDKPAVSYTYDFTKSKVNLPTNSIWNTSIPTDIQDGDNIYASTAIFSSHKDDTTAAPTNQGVSGWSGVWQVAQRKDGVAANFWFQKSVGQPTYSTTSTGVTNPGSSWSDTIGGASGTGYLWSIKGSSVSGSAGTLFTFGAPEKIDGDVAAEIVLYTKSAGDVPKPTQSYTYDFTKSKVNLPANSIWNTSIPTDIQNGEKIYASTAIFSSHKDDTTAAPTNEGALGWSGVWQIAKRKDGVATSYRGDWSTNGNNTEYFGTDYRGDIIKYNGNYYICVESHTTTSSNPETPDTSSKWEPFGAEFSSVATGLLLAEDGYIASKLEVGENGVGGVLRSNQFQGGLFNSDTRQPRTTDDYEPAGYLLATDFENNTTIAYFDVGGINPKANSSDSSEILSYIRYSSAKGKVEIKGTFINNSIIDTGFGYTGSGALSTYINNMLDGGQAVDELGSFVGGGYNNVFISNPDNVVDNIASLIAGGAENQVSSHFSAIGGGYANICKDNFSVIAGGFENSMPAEEDGNIQGSNGILSGVENSISGGTNQTILNGTKNIITQTTLLSQTGTAGEVRLDDIHSSISTGYWKYGANEITIELGNWITGSWFPGMLINNMENDSFFVQSFCLTREWIFSAVYGWAYVYWARDDNYNRSVYLRDFSVGLDLWIFCSNWGSKSGWWFIPRDAYFEFAPDYGLIWNNEESAWYYIRRTSSNETQVYKEGSGPWITVF